MPHQIIIATGRPESLRERTSEWLHRRYPRLDVFPLFMRANDDFRESPIVKRDLIECHRRIGQAVILVDDDPLAFAALGYTGGAFVHAPMDWKNLRDVYSPTVGDLLVIDIDGTLAAPPEIPDGGFEEFRSRILTTDPEPIPEAIAALEELFPCE